MSLRLVAVRHGETTLNASGVITGQLDPPLTALGREQARALAPVLSGLSFDVVAHSGSVRTAQTLALALPGVVDGDDVEVDARWRERSFGALEGTPRAAWVQPDDLAFAPPGGGESYRALAVRVGAAVDALRARGPARVLLVTHSGVLRTLTALAGGGDAAFLAPGAPNGALIELVF